MQLDGDRAVNVQTPTYVLELLDKNRVPITEVRTFVPLDNEGNFLHFNRRLSNYGLARFRIATKDPLLVKWGDIVKPNANHVRIWRNNSVIWQGIVVKNPHRTRLYIEIVAFEYLYLLKRVPLRRDQAGGNGEENYRNFKSGSLATVVTTLINEAKADGPISLQSVTVGTIDNPNFPANFTNSSNQSIGGQAWNFSDQFQIKFDIRPVQYAIDQFAVYAICDYELTKDLVFNFRTKIGTDKTNLVFEYSQYGQIDDYDAPRDGEQQANLLTGVAADNDFNILKYDWSDQTSISEYGKLWDVVAYADVKNINLLRSRTSEEGRLAATPDIEFNMKLNQNAYPLGQYDLGDTITLKVADHANQVSDQRRIVGYDVKVHNTARESISLVTNKPRNQ